MPDIIPVLVAEIKYLVGDVPAVNKKRLRMSDQWNRDLSRLD